MEREKAHTGELEPLIVNKGRKPVFKDLKIRPSIASGRGSGTLEVHTNGFRYIYNGKDIIDIVFRVFDFFLFSPP